MPTTINDKCAIVGIGQTKFSKHSGGSELQLALECVKAAIEDAGLKLSDVDGMVTLSIDGSDEIAVMRGLGSQELKFFSRVPHGIGGAMGLVHQAVMAISAGICETVVCYRALNGYSGAQPKPTAVGGPLSTDQVHWGWYTPYGLVDPASWAAMFTRRYMHEYGATDKSLAEIAVTMRKHATLHEGAQFRNPISVDDVMASRSIASPLKMLDCCPVSDGGCAFVISAKAEGPNPVRISGAAQHHNAQHISALASLTNVGAGACTASALADAGRTLADVEHSAIYDSFTITLTMLLEEIGLAPRGRAGALAREGHFDADGAMPLNLHGGLLSYGHCGVGGAMAHLAEAHLQMTGRAGARQAPRAGVTLLHGDGGVLSSHVSLVIEAA